MNRSETVFAQLTPEGRSAIATLVVAGRQAMAVVEQHFRPLSKMALADYPLQRIIFGKWLHQNGTFEELVIARTDVATFEIHCHGGVSAVAAVAESLEDAGVIRGYHADIDGDALGYSVTIFAFVGLTSQAETDLQDFEAMVGDWDMVRECHMLMGETDFLLKIVAHDWDDFQRFLTTKLTPAPNVSHVKTALSIRARKTQIGVPVLLED